MYSLKPIVTYDYDVPLPTTMYSVKKLNPSFEENARTLNIIEQVTSLLKKDKTPMALLEARQNNLLKQLDTLQRMIKELKLSCNAETVLKGSVDVKHKQVPLPSEIVINTSYDLLPFSLLVIQKVIKSINLNVSYHVHSSLPKEHTNKVHDFMKKFKNQKQQLNSIKIRIIFIEGGCGTEMKLSSVTPTAIQGEMNLLRYLSYLMPDLLHYDSDLKAESVLDICHLIQRNTSNKAQITKLFTVMDKNWVCGNEMTVADIAAYTVLKQLDSSVKNLPAHVKSWLDKCNKLFE